MNKRKVEAIKPAESPRLEANDPVWAALREAGVGLNRRTRRLAALPHVTPEYITAHYLGLKQEGKGAATGLLKQTQAEDE